MVNQSYDYITEDANSANISSTHIAFHAVFKWHSLPQDNVVVPDRFEEMSMVMMACFVLYIAYMSPG